MPHPLIIALAADENYLDGLAGTLAGVVRSAPGAHIRAVILDCGIADESWRDFKRTVLPRLRTLELQRLPVHPEQLQVFAPDTRVRSLNNSTYTRMLLPELLPDCDRVLYLDCDLLVNADLRELVSLPLDDALAGEVPENHLPLLEQNITQGILSADEASLPAFNSGVLLMDLAAMRGADLLGHVAGLLPKLQGKLQSQAVLNYLLRGRWKAVPARWNRQRFITEHFSLYHDHPGSVWHFIGKMKPWHFDPPHMRGLVADFHRDIIASGWKPRLRGTWKPLSPAWRDFAKASRAFTLRHTRSLE
jgi:lipopolysaccharide biosynthesis glycosyltransferase